jgi:hypothetical protein
MLKFILYTFISYWIYQNFFAPKRQQTNHDDTQRHRHESAKNEAKFTKNDGEFIDYEEIK